MKNYRSLVASAALATLVLFGCKKETADPILQNQPEEVSFKGPGNNNPTPITDTIFVSLIEVNYAADIDTRGPKGNFGFPTYIGEAAYVTVVNNQGNLISGVTVTGIWAGCFNVNNKSAITNSNGVARVMGANHAPSGCTATFTVTGLSKSGAYYNASANVVSSGSKVYP
jgi:hypothetical protein